MLHCEGMRLSCVSWALVFLFQDDERCLSEIGAGGLWDEGMRLMHRMKAGFREVGRFRLLGRLVYG